MLLTFFARESKREMRSTLFDFVGKYLPLVPGKLRTRLLYNCTSHPCGNQETVKEQILRLARETDGTFEGCMAFSDKEFEEQVEGIEDYEEIQ